MDIELESLVNAYMRNFDGKKNLRVVVPNSIPIVWFGDLAAYEKSPVKVVTIGLNPSLKEFDCWPPRFDTRANNAAALYKTLCNYYNDNPHNGYFSHFERCLNRLGTSYSGKMTTIRYTNTAIHIDAYSSIATNPTWGNLMQNQKDSVNQQELCQQFLEYLQPNVVLMSTAHHVFVETLHINTRPMALYEYSGKGVIKVYKEHGQLFTYGINMKGQPFGGIPNELLDKAFEVIRQEIKLNL